MKEDPRILVRAKTVWKYLEGKVPECSVEGLRNVIGDKRIRKMYEVIWKEEQQKRLEVLLFGRKESRTKEQTMDRVWELLLEAIREKGKNV